MLCSSTRIRSMPGIPRATSDNGPQGEVVREFGGDMPDMGSPGPFLRRTSPMSAKAPSALHTDPLAGSDWTEVILRDVLDHGFFPHARAPGGWQGAGDDRPIDGLDQTYLLLGTSDARRQDALLTFVGPEPYAGSSSTPILPTWCLAAVVGSGARLLPGTSSSAASMNGYPKVFNIELDDPRHDALACTTKANSTGGRSVSDFIVQERVGAITYGRIPSN